MGLSRHPRYYHEENELTAMNHQVAAECDDDQQPTPTPENKLHLLSKELMINHVTTTTTNTTTSASTFQNPKPGIVRRRRSLGAEVAALRRAANNDYDADDDDDSNRRPAVVRRASMPKVGEDSDEDRGELVQRFSRRASLPMSFGGSEQQQVVLEGSPIISAQHPILEQLSTESDLNLEPERPGNEQPSRVKNSIKKIESKIAENNAKSRLSRGKADNSDNDNSSSEKLHKGKKIERKIGTISRLKQASALMGPAPSSAQSADNSLSTHETSEAKIRIGGDTVMSKSDHHDDHSHNRHRRTNKNRRKVKQHSFNAVSGNDLLPLLPPKPLMARTPSCEIINDDEEFPPPGKLKRESSGGVGRGRLKREGSGDVDKHANSSHRRRASNDPGINQAHGGTHHSHRRASNDPGNKQASHHSHNRRASNDPGHRSHKRASPSPSKHMSRQGSNEPSNHSHRRASNDPGNHSKHQARGEESPKEDGQEHELHNSDRKLHPDDEGHNHRHHHEKEESHNLHDGGDDDHDDSSSYFEESVVSFVEEVAEDPDHAEPSASAETLEEVDDDDDQETEIEVVSDDDESGSGGSETSSYDSQPNEEEESEHSTGSGYTIELNSLACESEVSFSQYGDELDDSIYNIHDDNDDDNDSIVEISYHSDMPSPLLHNHKSIQESPAKPQLKSVNETATKPSPQKSSLLGALPSHYATTPAALLYEEESDDED